MHQNTYHHIARNVVIASASVLFFAPLISSATFINNASEIPASQPDPIGSVIKQLLPDSTKGIMDVVNSAQEKIKSGIGEINVKSLITDTTSQTTAGSSQAITPQYATDIVTKVTSMVSNFDSTGSSGFLERAYDILNQFIKYMYDLALSIIHIFIK